MSAANLGRKSTDERQGPDPTRDRLIDSATQLLVERGFDHASVREITQHAGMNLAAVNYHFGSKDRLLEAVMWRQLRRLLDLRQHRLSELLELCRVEGRTPTFDEVVDSWFDPAIELLQRDALSVGLIDRIAQYLMVDRKVDISFQLFSEMNHVLRLFARQIPAELVGTDERTVMATLLRASQLLVASAADFGVRSLLRGCDEMRLFTPWEVIKTNLKFFVKESISGARSLTPPQAE